MRLDPELKERLVRRAEHDGVPVSEVIREALRHHLEAADTCPRPPAVSDPRRSEVALIDDFTHLARAVFPEEMARDLPEPGA